tara:strand:- start:1121 stop:1453 length:333 start_codon:yes stop_codon:yes gene_type:complete
MPLYPYLCKICSYGFDIAKPLNKIEDIEACQKCGCVETQRMIALASIEKSSIYEPYYEPALGTVIKSKSQKEQVMKQLGVEEVGNTSTDTMYKDFEVERENRIKQSWEKL